MIDVPDMVPPSFTYGPVSAVAYPIAFEEPIAIWRVSDTLPLVIAEENATVQYSVVLTAVSGAVTVPPDPASVAVTVTVGAVAVVVSVVMLKGR